jgi:hypothetical protein
MNSGRKEVCLPHLKNVNHAVMTVGGWFDAEDLSGPLNIYKTIEKTSPKAKNNCNGTFLSRSLGMNRENISTTRFISETALQRIIRKM